MRRDVVATIDRKLTDAYLAEIPSMLINPLSEVIGTAMLFMQRWGIKAMVKPLENKHLDP